MVLLSLREVLEEVHVLLCLRNRIILLITKFQNKFSKYYTCSIFLINFVLITCVFILWLHIFLYKLIILISVLHYQNLLRMENIKESHKAINLKYQKQHGMKSLNCLVDLIPYQIFKNILSTSSRTMKHCQISRQSKYMSSKFRMELHSRLKPVIFLNSRHLGL